MSDHSTKEEQHGSHSGDDVAGLVERAFHYRGDVTVRTAEGREVIGYLFNRGRSASGSSAQLFEAGTGRQVTIPYGSIADVLFTGPDAASGKHFQHRREESDRIVSPPSDRHSTAEE